jgi:ribosome-associated heat shock protein Hsp15
MNANKGNHDSKDAEVRIDKWLWAARFFKTRSLAQQALEHGQVKVDGQKTRPSRKLAIGARLAIEKGEDIFVVTVLALSDRRGNAETAQQLYRESDADRAERLAAAETRRLAWASMPAPVHRPDKKQRRTLQQLKHQN